MIWCLGMYGSASTWVYNVVLLLLGEGGAPARGAYVVRAADLDEAALVAKTHQVEPDAEAMLAARATAIVASVRDPRDAVASMMQYMHVPFATAAHYVALSARAVAARADDPRTLLLRYETGFADDPATIGRIAAAVGAAADALRLDRVRAATTRAAVEAHVRALPGLATAQRDARSGDVVDLATQWHTHHAGRSGEIGRWRSLLTVPQAALIEADLADWMARFGYEPVFATTGDGGQTRSFPA